MKILIQLLSLQLLTMTLNGQSVFGTWQSYHPETGEPLARIKIYEDDGKACAEVVDILHESVDQVCKNCKGELKNKPVEGLKIIWNLKRKNDRYFKKGRLLDPSSGKSYKCFVKLKNPNKLKLRAYAGFRALGKTQYLSRIDEYEMDKMNAVSAGE